MRAAVRARGRRALRGRGDRARAGGAARRPGAHGGQRRVSLGPVGAERHAPFHVPHRPRPRRGRAWWPRWARRSPGWRVGDHVVLTWMPPCRQCFWCLAGQPMLCERGHGRVDRRSPTPRWAGTPARPGPGHGHLRRGDPRPRGRGGPRRPAVPLELAALVGCALSTGIGAVWHTAGVRARVDGGRHRLRRRGAVGHPGGPPGRGLGHRGRGPGGGQAGGGHGHGGHPRGRLVGRGRRWPPSRP